MSKLQPNGTDVVVKFPTILGKTYRVDGSITLQSGSWTTVQDNIAGTGGEVQVTDPNGAAQQSRFYRILVH